MSSIFSFLRRLFSREKAAEPGSLAEELWAAELSGPKTGRFEVAELPSHEAAYREGALELSLKRPGLFAWTEAKPYLYADFVAEACLELPASGYGAAGLLFRYADEGNFYLLLVSNRGYFRLDVLFNGNPRTIIAWTELPARQAEPAAPLALRLIARGRHFLVFLDGAWAGEAEDDTQRSGSLAFAAQRYAEEGSSGAAAKAGLPEGERPGPEAEAPAAAAAAATEPSAAAAEKAAAAEPLAFRLDSLLLESRPVEVEALYQSAAHYSLPEPGARRRLAETYHAMGQYLGALVQLRRLEKARPLEAGEQFLRAEASIRLELYEEAEAALDACLALGGEPELARSAAAEKANLLYLRGRYPELRELSRSLAAREPENPRFPALEGHALFNLGDYTGAAAAYARAAAAAPDQPLLRMNEARAWDQAGARKEALAAYLAAAEGFYEAEAEDDLALALARLGSLKAPPAALKALKAKALFRGGKRLEAGRLIESLLKAGCRDSAIHYLGGILAAEAGDRPTALERFEAALRLEPGIPLYAFRRAEALFLLGRPEAREAVEKAIAEAPGDGWTLNLGGLLLLTEFKAQDEASAKAGSPLDPEAAALARRRLEAAARALPDSEEPALNLAELDALEGRFEAALAGLAAYPESARAHNQAGNILVRAARLYRDGPGQLSGLGGLGGPGGRGGPETASSPEEEAEALLYRALREYEAATRLEPGRSDFEENLAALYLELERYSDAEEWIRKALDSGGGARSYLLAGNLALAYGEGPRAEAAYRLGLEREPRDPSLLLALGRKQLAVKAYDKAEESLRRLEAADPGRAARFAEELLDARTEKLGCSSCGRGWRVPRELPAQSAANIRAMPPDDSPAGSCPSCGRSYCIACRKGELRESRFTCPSCGDFLKLSDPRLRWLVRESLKNSVGQP